jgi:membrane associated rhomboid family serine protease
MVIFERRVPPIVGALIAMMLIATTACALDARRDGQLYDLLALWPAQIWRGEVWRLVTWPFVEGSPVGLLFGCVTVFWCGSDLAGAWGQARFGRYVAAIVLVAGAGTSVIALALPAAAHYPHLAGWALVDALVITWALQFPAERLRIYYLLVVGGTDLAYLTIGMTGLFALFFGVSWFLPELIASSAALLVMTDRLPRWRRRQPRRRPNLRVVRDDDDPRWVN